VWENIEDTNILIVEDDPFNRLLIKSRFSKVKNIRFFEAEDGIEALAILKNNNIDMMLLDLHMPNLNGKQTLIKMQEDKRYDDIAILVMSTDDVAKKEFEDIGVDDFILKPFRLDELELQVNQNIRRRLFKLNRRIEPKNKKKPISYTIEDIEKSQKDFFLKMIMHKTKDNKEERIKAKIIASVSKVFAQKIGYSGKALNHIYYASLIRDIGLIGVCTREYDADIFSIKDKKKFYQNILAGYDILSSVLETDFMTIAKKIILEYNEFHDGTGMPYGLRGEEISDVAIIVGIAETFEALLGKRKYRKKESFTPEEAYDIFVNSRGRYNRRILDTFLNNFDEFIALREKILSLSLGKKRD